MGFKKEWPEFESQHDVAGNSIASVTLVATDSTNDTLLISQRLKDETDPSQAKSVLLNQANISTRRNPMATQADSNRKKLLAQLKDLEWHSWAELESLAGNRYGARLHELREAGYKLVSRPSALALNQDGKDYRLIQKTKTIGVDRKVKVYLTPAQAHSLRIGVVTPSIKEVVGAAVYSYERNYGNHLDDI